MHARSTARLSRGEVLRLTERCAPTTPPATLASLADVESGFDPLTIHDNATGASYHPTTLEAAVALARTLLSRSSNVDLGLVQINSRNLSEAGLDVRSAFDPCRNLAAAGRIIDRNYARALGSSAGAPLLQTAYSLYNTGKLQRGFHNGYADKVVAATHRANRKPAKAAAGALASLDCGAAELRNAGE